MHDKLDSEIAVLTSAIVADDGNYDLYMERGRLYYRGGNFGSALNDFMKAAELRPDSGQAQEYVAMIHEILEFRYKDIYNP